MQEYTADELAEDSGDEKRLEKVEKAAELKAAKRRKKKASSVQSSRSRSLSVRETVRQHDGANTSAQSGGPLLRVWRDGPHAHELSEGSCP